MRELAIVALFGLSVGSAAADPTAVLPPLSGKQLAFDNQKGNCLACHKIEGGEFPGDIGPSLVGMRQLFPNREALRAQIYDATIRNPNTVMPPFGKNGILKAGEIDLITDYIYGL